MFVISILLSGVFLRDAAFILLRVLIGVQLRSQNMTNGFYDIRIFSVDLHGILGLSRLSGLTHAFRAGFTLTAALSKHYQP